MNSIRVKNTIYTYTQGQWYSTQETKTGFQTNKTHKALVIIDYASIDKANAEKHVNEIERNCDKRN